MMEKEKVDRIENAVRAAFLADPPAPAEPPHWQYDTMREIRAAAAAPGASEFYWFSPRQERILWRGAWAALAAGMIICAGYFGLNMDHLDTDFASITVVEVEGY